MFGRCVSRERGISKYDYGGRHYLLSDHDLRDLQPRIPQSAEALRNDEP